MDTHVHTEIAFSRDAAPELGNALERGLGQPITALRASMEALARDLATSDPRDPHARQLNRALSEVTRLGRNVGDLLDYAYPPQPCPLECTIDEILYSARFQLPHTLWQHLFIARDKGAATEHLFVDGPVLARSIARLVESVTHPAEPSSNLMLRAHIDGGRVAFTITLEGASDPLRHQADPTGLCHSIAQRDLGVIGCTIQERCCSNGGLTFRIALPHDALCNH